MPAVFLKSATGLAEIPTSDKPQIAMVGRSNVGKSSLINDLVNQKNLARTSSEPGRTQMMNLFEVDKRYLLIDLPGYGFAKASKAKRAGFADMIQDYLWQATQLKLVLLIVDARVGLTELDRDMLAYLQSGRIPFIMIANKIDKLAHSESINIVRTLEATLPSVAIIPHSNITRLGCGEILETIERAIRVESTPSS